MWTVKHCFGPSVFESTSLFFQSVAVKSVPRSFGILTTARNTPATCKHVQYPLFWKNSIYKLNPQVRSRAVAATATVARKNAVNAERKVGYWLLLCSSMVGGAITLGGYTRLTESGLSMVTWRFLFESIPKSEQQWVEEFAKYQEYPEFKQLKKNLTLEEFKKIWINEYTHRLWGRCTGIVFLIPAAAYWLKGYFKKAMKKRILVFGSLIAAQGLLGWYMVQSGLEDRFHEQGDIPRVSQYRLASHLGLALTLYTGLTWTALDILLPSRPFHQALEGLKRLRILTHSCKGMVFLTALSGAFVAGLDAGLVYNSFPKMGDKWIPDDIAAMTPFFKNIFENPTTAQFDHRIMGLSTFTLVMATWALSKRFPLPRTARLAANVLAMAAIAQVSLGISTLVRHVPLPEAVSHQTGSVILLTICIWLAQELKKLKYLPK